MSAPTPSGHVAAGPLPPQDLTSLSATGGSWSSRRTARPSRTRPRFDSALVKALARAHRWQRLLESGKCASVTELAAAEKIERSYLCRVLGLTLLAPEIVEAIMEGRQAAEVTLPALMKGFPVGWESQRVLRVI